MAAVSITLRDLVGQPHLRLEVLAAPGGLDRAVSWAHSSDLPQPWDWLSGGELLMKNGRTLPRSAAGQAALLEGLAAAGVSALVIGTDPDTPQLTARAVSLAAKLRTGDVTPCPETCSREGCAYPGICRST